jgi:hypothetical protein
MASSAKSIKLNTKPTNPAEKIKAVTVDRVISMASR